MKSRAISSSAGPSLLRCFRTHPHQCCACEAIPGKIAQVRRFIENGMGLVAVAAPGYDHGKVVAGVIDASPKLLPITTVVWSSKVPSPSLI